MGHGYERIGKHHDIGDIPEGARVVVSVRNHVDMLGAWCANAAPDFVCPRCGSRSKVPADQWIGRFLAGHWGPETMKYFPAQDGKEDGDGSLYGLYLARANELVRFESLAEDIRRVFGFENVPHIGAGKSAAHFSPRNVGRIRATYRKEMQSLGYL